MKRQVFVSSALVSNATPTLSTVVSTTLLSAVLMAAVAISGCGQKGPLYLPERNGTVVTRPGAGAQPNTSDGAATPQTNQTVQPTDTTTLPSSTPNEASPSGSLKQQSGPATQSASTPRL